MWVHLVQNSASWKDPISSLAAIDSLLLGYESIKEKGGWLLLPELFAQGFVTDWNLDQDLLLIHEQQKIILDWMQQKSDDWGITVAGSLAFYENGRLFNRFVAVPPQQDLFSYPTYNKKHLFGLAGEDKVYQAGSLRTIWREHHWTIIPSICYDLRFPVWLRNRGDYQVLFCVANWPQVRAFAWRSLLTARAIENQSFVVGVNRVGTDATGTFYSGESMVIGPDGSLLVQMNDEAGIVSCLLDEHVLAVFRRAYPFLKDADDFELRTP